MGKKMVGFCGMFLVALCLQGCRVPKEQRASALGQLFAQMRNADEQQRAGILKRLSGERPQTAEEVRIIAREMEGGLYPIAQQMMMTVNDKSLLLSLLDAAQEKIGKLKNWSEKDFEKMNPQEQKEAQRRLGNVEAIIVALGNLKDARAVAVLKDCMNYDALSYAASTALGKIGDENTLNELLQQVGSKREINVSAFGDKALLRVAKELDDPSTQGPRRGALIEQIKGSAKPEVNVVLRDLALNNKDPEVRQRAGQALVNSIVINPSAADPEFIANWTQKLIDKNDRDSVEAAWAVTAMKLKWDKRYIPVLLQVLRTSRDEAARAYAAEDLGQQKIQEAVPDLEKALLDNDSGVRSSAFQALEDILGYEKVMEKYYDLRYIHPKDRYLYPELLNKNK